MQYQPRPTRDLTPVQQGQAATLLEQWVDAVAYLTRGGDPESRADRIDSAQYCARKLQELGYVME